MDLKRVEDVSTCADFHHVEELSSSDSDTNEGEDRGCISIHSPDDSTCRQ